MKLFLHLLIKFTQLALILAPFILFINVMKRETINIRHLLNWELELN